MASQRSRTIWEQSTPLSQFAANEISNEFHKTPLVAARLRWLGYLLKMGDGLFSHERVSEQIRGAIWRGELIATGWRVLPSKSGGPVEIPPEQIVDGRFRVFSDSVDCGKFSYGEVCLVAKADLPKSLLAARPNQHVRQLKIQGVVWALSDTGQLAGKLRKQQIPIVRDALINAGVENVGSDKTIERLIRINSKTKKSI